MAKKYDLHSELHIIDQNKSPKTIAEDMYHELYNFKDDRGGLCFLNHNS